VRLAEYGFQDLARARANLEALRAASLLGDRVDEALAAAARSADPDQALRSWSGSPRPATSSRRCAIRARWSARSSSARTILLRDGPHRAVERERRVAGAEHRNGHAGR
jgi:hypothetical protein